MSGFRSLRPGMVSSMSTGSKASIWFVRKHPRKAARVGMTLARNPKRTAAAVKLGRSAPDIVRKARDAKGDPRLRDHMVETRDALTSARDRLRGSNDLAGAVTDEKLWSELRRAAAAMAAGYAVAQDPKPKRRRGMRKFMLAVGVIGAGAYAGYRATRGMGDGA
jgi:hypothetical protein